MCNTYCFSKATIVARTCLNVTLYLYCLSFSSVLAPETRFYSWPLPFIFQNHNSECISHLSHACYVPILPQPRSFDKPSNIWRKVRTLLLLIMYEHCCSSLCTNSAAPHYVRTVLLLIMYEQCCSSLRNFLSNSRCSFSPSGVNIFVGILLSVCILSSAWETGISKAFELLTITVPLYLP